MKQHPTKEQWNELTAHQKIDIWRALNVALDAYRKIGYEIVGAYKKVDTSNSDVKLN